MKFLNAILPSYHTRTSKWLLIPIELMHRELTSKLLLACVAAERGYSVIISEQFKFRNMQARFPKGVIIEKGCGSGDIMEDVFSSYKNTGHLITVSDEETPSIYSLPESWCKTRVANRTFDKCDRFFSWGDKQTEIMSKFLNVENDKFVSVGSHRVDVWRKPMFHVHQATANGYRKKHGRYILMPSNFAGEIDARGSDFQLVQAKKYGTVTNEKEEKRLIEFLKYKKTITDKFVEIFPKIVEAFPDHTLIIRPHPVDDNSFWERAIVGLPRAKVIYEGEATPWLLGADAIFHNGCTTALEANMMGLQPLTYMPVQNKEHDDIFLCECGPIAYDEDQLIKNISDVIDGNQLDYALANKMENYVSTINETLSCDRMVDVFDDLNIEITTNTFNLMQYLHKLREFFRPNFLKKISMATRKRSRNSNVKPKWPGLHLDELENRIQGYREQLDRFGDVRVTDYQRRMFLIYKK